MPVAQLVAHSAGFRYVVFIQRGYIFLSHGAWRVRYRAEGKQKCRKLALDDDQHRTVKSVR
jgi:hypothetical protein